MRTGNLPDLASADVFQRLLKERIIFLGSAIDETVANQVCAQLLLLAAENSERRLVYRVQMCAQWLVPLFVLALGAVVFTMAVAYFTPLLVLIEKLAS